MSCPLGWRGVRRSVIASSRGGTVGASARPCLELVVAWRRLAEAALRALRSRHWRQPDRAGTFRGPRR
ncbi:MAG: hypothetical protein AAF170_01835, partial [Bacteroidota bacterium]